MKEKPITICLFSYRPSYYLTHPHLFIKDLWIGAKNLWHRARYGFAYIDVWNMCDYIPELMGNMCEYLAEYHSAYPNGWTPQEWEEHLRYMSMRFRRHGIHMRDTDERNEFQKAFNEMCARIAQRHVDECGNVIWSSKEMTEEDKIIKNKYLAREKEIVEADDEYDRETFEMFGKDLNLYWD